MDTDEIYAGDVDWKATAANMQQEIDRLRESYRKVDTAHDGLGRLYVKATDELRERGDEIEYLRGRLDESDEELVRLRAIEQRAREVFAGRVDDFVLGDADQAELLSDVTSYILDEGSK